MAILMLGHLRLALIEEHQGNQKEKLRHLEIAKEACNHRKFKDCSDDKLIWYAKRRDESIQSPASKMKTAQQSHRDRPGNNAGLFIKKALRPWRLMASVVTENNMKKDRFIYLIVNHYCFSRYRWLFFDLYIKKL